MKKISAISSLLAVALYAFVGSFLILNAVDVVTALSENPTHLVQFIPHLTLLGSVVGILNILPSQVLANSPIVAGLSTYSGKYVKQILGNVWNSLDTSEITVLTGISEPTKFPKLTIARGLAPYAPAFAAVDDLTYTDRTLTPVLAKREMLIEPKKYMGTFMMEQLGKKATDKNIPFEAFTFQKLTEQVGGEINDYVIGLGDTANADNARKICDGVLKLVATDLTAGEYTALATGAWTNVNAVTKAESLFKSLPAVWKGKDTNMYMSIDNFFNYLEAYRAAYPYDVNVYTDGSQALYIKHSRGKCKITPVTWLGSSGRVIITPKENIVLGTDQLSDINAIEIIQDVWTVKMGMSFLIGLVIPDPAAIWVNDQV